MTDFRVMVVDDEPLARRQMSRLLSEYADFEVIGQAGNVVQAATLYQATQPDVVFLDIQMPGEDGFGLFRHCDVQAHVVFVTAFDEHAVRAFRFNALDYLLKPVSRALLEQTIDRIRRRERHQSQNVALQSQDKVRIKTSSGSRFVAISQIDAVVAAGDYTELWLSDASIPLSSRSLKEWEDCLSREQFLRVHRSVLVRAARVSQLKSEKSAGLLWLQGHKDSLPVSRRLLSVVKKTLGGI